MRLGLLSVVACLLTLLFSCHGVRVFQPKTQRMNQDDTVSIICELREPKQHNVKDVRLNQLLPPKMICQVNGTQPNCTWMKITEDQYKFTLHNLKLDEAGYLLQCEFTINHPAGNFETIRSQTSTNLLPADTETAQLSDSPPCIKEPERSNLLQWIVIGMAAFLCFYSSLITFFYIRLRVIRSEELYDSLTYVHMQPNQVEAMRARVDAANNPTYVDMRKIPFGNSRSNHSKLHY